MLVWVPLFVTSERLQSGAENSNAFHQVVEAIGDV